MFTPIVARLFILIALLQLGCSDVVRYESNSTKYAQACACEKLTIGRLGAPLGRVFEIRATVIAGRDLNTKADAGHYLLRVSGAGEMSFPEPIVMAFEVPGFADVELAHNGFSLYKMKTGKEARSLDDAQIARLEEGYVGKEMRLVVYEIGAYSGIPADLPQDVPAWQDHAFGFSTWLVVLAERK